MSGPENITWIGVAASAVSAAVTITTVYMRARTKRTLAAINSGTPEAARIAAGAVTSVELATANLTKEQIFRLAKKEIAAARASGHAATMIMLGEAVISTGPFPGSLPAGILFSGASLGLAAPLPV